MKIEGRAPASAAGAVRSGGAQSQGGFSISGTASRETAAAGPSAGVGGLGSLDALLALQETASPLERRRRAVRRAGRMLDALDALKLALLEERAPPETLARLRDAIAEERGLADEPGLQAVLDEIETRAAVEVAKQEAAGLGVAI